MFTYGFYNSIGGDRKYDAEQFGAIFDGVINDGVYQTIGGFLATVPNSGMQVAVKPGRAWFNHTWSLNDTLLLLTLDESDVLRTRIDAVVLEVNTKLESRENSIKIVPGEFSTNPVKPTLTNDGEVYQHALAYVTVLPGATEIKEENIEIVVGKSETPFVMSPVKTVPIDDLFNRWNGEFNAWFENLKEQLSDDVVGNLQKQIDEKVDLADKATPEDIQNGTPGKWVDASLAQSDIMNMVRGAKIGDIVFSGRNLEEETDGEFLACDGRTIVLDAYPDFPDDVGYPPLVKVISGNGGLNQLNSSYYEPPYCSKYPYIYGCGAGGATSSVVGNIETGETKATSVMYKVLFRLTDNILLAIGESNSTFAILYNDGTKSDITTETRLKNITASNFLYYGINDTSIFYVATSNVSGFEVAECGIIYYDSDHAGVTSRVIGNIRSVTDNWGTSQNITNMTNHIDNRNVYHTGCYKHPTYPIKLDKDGNRLYFVVKKFSTVKVLSSWSIITNEFGVKELILDKDTLKNYIKEHLGWYLIKINLDDYSFDSQNLLTEDLVDSISNFADKLVRLTYEKGTSRGLPSDASFSYVYGAITVKDHYITPIVFSTGNTNTSNIMGILDIDLKTGTHKIIDCIDYEHLNERPNDRFLMSKLIRNHFNENNVEYRLLYDEKKEVLYAPAYPLAPLIIDVKNGKVLDFGGTSTTIKIPSISREDIAGSSGAISGYTVLNGQGVIKRIGQYTMYSPFSAVDLMLFERFGITASLSESAVLIGVTRSYYPDSFIHGFSSTRPMWFARAVIYGDSWGKVIKSYTTMTLDWIEFNDSLYAVGTNSGVAEWPIFKERMLPFKKNGYIKVLEHKKEEPDVL